MLRRVYNRLPILLGMYFLYLFDCKYFKLMFSKNFNKNNRNLYLLREFTIYNISFHIGTFYNIERFEEQ